jgi:hypothetical protein
MGHETVRRRRLKVLPICIQYYLLKDTLLGCVLLLRYVAVFVFPELYSTMSSNTGAGGPDSKMICDSKHILLLMLSLCH